MSRGPALYTVVLLPEAEADASHAGDYIAQRSPASAAKWIAGLERAIQTLERLPNRCGVARERSHRGLTLRQLIHHSHRVLFTVNDESRTVHIHRIIHAAQDGWDRRA